MVLELHVWGPGFSLPSIDAQCLATIAYFSLAVPKDSWVLVASSDPTVSPTHELPALKNGSTWVSRFRNIVDYLRQYSNGAWDLDRDLSALEKADSIAFSSFVESRTQALLDLSLYVTSQNYYNSTSPAYGAILQWPNQWIIPPQLHDAAKSRTEPLGLSSLDLEEMEQQQKRDHSAAIAAGRIPQNFIRRPRETVSGLLGRTSQQNQFRLEALTAELFQPLEEALGDKTNFLSGQAARSSLDCLAVGYLSLALVPDLPHKWLRNSMQRKAPRLSQHIDRMRRELYGTVNVSDAFSSSGGSSLPWQAPDRARLVTVGTTLLNSLADATPILKDIRLNNRLRETAEASDSGLSPVESQSLAAYARGQSKDTLLSIATVIGGVAALLGYMVHVGVFSAQEEGEEEDHEQEHTRDYEDQEAEVQLPESVNVSDFLGVNTAAL
ncbi:Tom37 C-terminal domain-containing protein [Aspergillus cavernicola]|uniref:Tom37 C-terminal domain-containing protein n=1 Tax=Aspergillus cavernicola TaxID=176166 RepID=A0ABR4I9S4_9EURO